MSCPHCREVAGFKGYRSKGLLSALGPLAVERGHCPAADALDLDAGDLTAGDVELATLAGTLESFTRPSEVILPKLSGLSIVESTVERTAEAAGAALGHRGEGPLRRGRAWAWHKDAEGKSAPMWRST